MVKKIYIQPNMVVKNIATQSMIAESLRLSSEVQIEDSEEILVKDDRDGFFSDEW